MKPSLRNEEHESSVGRSRDTIHVNMLLRKLRRLDPALAAQLDAGGASDLRDRHEAVVSEWGAALEALRLERQRSEAFAEAVETFWTIHKAALPEAAAAEFEENVLRYVADNRHEGDE